MSVPQRKWHQEYGDVVRYFYPFGTERLSVIDQESIKQITMKNPYNYPKPLSIRNWMARILGRDGILLAEGDSHIQQRKALAPGFSTQSIKTLYPIFWRKALLLSEIWRQSIAKDNTDQICIEVLDGLNRTTLDIIGQAGFGTEFDSLRHPDAPLRVAYQAIFAFNFTARLYHALHTCTHWAHYLPLKMNYEMVKSRKVICDTATDIISRKLSEVDPKDKDIIALTLRGFNLAGAERLSSETMRDQIMTFLGAGHDTTATGAAWTLHLLAKYPPIQERLRAEIKQHMPSLFDPNLRGEDANLESIDVDQLPYLDNVCRESLRYIPPIPLTSRALVSEDRLGGYVIPAQTYVSIHANAINRLPQYWGPTAHEFDPDRWDHLPSTYCSEAFMTFLQGPRGCIGRKFAETEMKILLCSLLSMYIFEPDRTFDDPEEWKMWRLVLRPKDGIRLKASLLA
ncbi:cytochrome P450 monooxygenase [Physcia stellaris]|nr:cytochrome P450 monooxygenase [Physcia stellaris]